MRETQTHFDQIPVQTVKKIATEMTSRDIDTDIAASEKAHVARSPRERWQELAEKVQREQDPKKMVELVQQLIITLDERKLRTASR